MGRRAVLYFAAQLRPVKKGVLYNDQHGQASHQQKRTVPAGGQGTFCHQPQPHQLLHRRDHPKDPPFRGQGRGKGAGQRLPAQHHRGYRALLGRHTGHWHLPCQRADQGRLYQYERPQDHLHRHAGIHLRQPDHSAGQSCPHGQGQARPHSGRIHHHRLHHSGSRGSRKLLRRHRGRTFGDFRHHPRVPWLPGHLPPQKIPPKSPKLGGFGGVFPLKTGSCSPACAGFPLWLQCAERSHEKWNEGHF